METNCVPKLLPIQEGARDAMRAQLYQVMVTDVRTGLPKLVLPACLEEVAGLFCGLIRKQIIAGREREWADPVVIPVHPTIN